MLQTASCPAQQKAKVVVHAFNEPCNLSCEFSQMSQEAYEVVIVDGHLVVDTSKRRVDCDLTSSMRAREDGRSTSTILTVSAAITVGALTQTHAPMSVGRNLRDGWTA